MQCLPEPDSQADIFRSYNSSNSSQNAPELLHTDASSESSLSPPPPEQYLDNDNQIKIQDEDPSLVLLYPEYHINPTSESPSDYDARSLQHPVPSCGPLEYAYDMQGGQAVCSTASDVESVYLQYAYDPVTLQYTV